MKKLVFENMGDLLGYIEPKINSNSTSYSRGDVEFCGTETWQEAIDLAKHGWPEGTNKLKMVAEDISSKRQYENPSYRWDVCGQVFDVGLVVSGEPECWLETDYESAKRVIQIMVNISARHYIEKYQIINRGAAIMALIDALQSDTRNIVELVVVKRTTPRDKMTKEHQITLKLGTTPLDIDQVAYTIGHPSFLRRLLFSVAEVVCKKDHCGSYGASIDVPLNERGEWIYIPMLIRDNMTTCSFETVEESAEWVKGVLANIENGG